MSSDLNHSGSQPGILVFASHSLLTLLLPSKSRLETGITGGLISTSRLRTDPSSFWNSDKTYDIMSSQSLTSMKPILISIYYLPKCSATPILVQDIEGTL